MMLSTLKYYESQRIKVLYPFCHYQFWLKALLRIMIVRSQSLVHKWKLDGADDIPIIKSNKVLNVFICKVNEFKLIKGKYNPFYFLLFIQQKKIKQIELEFNKIQNNIWVFVFGKRINPSNCK